jgi:two-component system, OmpR family, KDP operon response regulator KdpE
VTKVLVIDDEPQIVRALRTSLQARDYEVLAAENGEKGLATAAAQQPDLIMLDLGLPDLDGAEVINRLRTWTDIPVIVLSVREGQGNKIEALDAGADDYVTKPFDVEEVLARMRATLRRAKADDHGAQVLTFGDVEVDLVRRLVRVQDEVVHLTPTEYGLLEAMVTNAGKLLTHQWLLRKVWGRGYAAENHYLHVYVRQLRQKLRDDPAMPRLIVTEPGVGYRWSSSETAGTSADATPSAREHPSARR